MRGQGLMLCPADVEACVEMLAVKGSFSRFCSIQCTADMALQAFLLEMRLAWKH